MVHRKLAIIVFTAAILSPCVRAQQAASRPCADSGAPGMETTAGIHGCLVQALEQVNAELATVFARARAAADDTALLESSQSAWQRYVDADCRAAADVYRGGSLAPVVALSCQLDHYRLRIRYLQNDYFPAGETAPGRRVLLDDPVETTTGSGLKN